MNNDNNNGSNNIIGLPQKQQEDEGIRTYRVAHFGPEGEVLEKTEEGLISITPQYVGVINPETKVLKFLVPSERILEIEALEETSAK